MCLPKPERNIRPRRLSGSRIIIHRLDFDHGLTVLAEFDQTQTQNTPLERENERQLRVRV